jgi:hypothetical protein
MPERRTLTFDGLDDVMAEVDRLLAGHETVGRWTLGQILYHLATAVRLSLEASEDATAVVEPDRARTLRRLLFRAGRFPDGADPPLTILLPPDSCDSDVQAEALRDAIARFLRADEPFASHPVLGAMSKAEWTRFHAMHGAHHLGFAIPTAAGQLPAERGPHTDEVLQQDQADDVAGHP